MTPEHRREIHQLEGELLVIADELSSLNAELAPGARVGDPSEYHELSRRRASLELREEAIYERIFKINWYYEGV